MPHPVGALVVLAPGASPDAQSLTAALTEGGWPVLGARQVDADTVLLPWLSDDGPRSLRVTRHVGVPRGRLGPRSPEADVLDQASAHLRLVLLEGPDERLDADVLLVALTSAVLDQGGAVAAKLEHLDAWLHPEDWATLLQRDLGFGAPAELLVDLEIGPVGPEAVGVLTQGLERYGLRELLAVADRDRLTDAWALAVSLAEDRLLGAEPEADLVAGPHPRRPGETVDVAFVDEDPDDGEEPLT